MRRESHIGRATAAAARALLASALATAGAAVSSASAAAVLPLAAGGKAQAQAIVDTWASEQAGTDVAVSLAIPGKGTIAGVNANEPEVAASVAKLYLAYIVLARVDDGAYGLDDHAGVCGTIRQCLETAIVWSDNDAANTLNDIVGWASLDQSLHAAGFDATFLNNVNGGHRFTTAADTSAILERLALGDGLSPTSNAMLLALMQRQNYRDGIPAGVPGVVVADKPGWLFDPDPATTNDAAIVYAPRATYTLVVLTDRAFNWKAIAELSRRLGVLFATSDSDADVAIAARPAQWGKVVPITPTRLVDTRQPDQPGALGRESAMTVQVTGIAGVPAAPDQVAAAVVNIAATSGRAGFVTAWGSGSMPLASVLNVDRDGQTVANLAIVPVGGDGKIRLYSSAGTHLVVDLQAYVAPAASSTGGRLLANTPMRVLDSRASGTPLVPKQDLVVPMTAPAGVGAAIVHLTAVRPSSSGWLSVAPGRAGTELVSNVNAEAGETRSNEAIVPIVDGAITLRSNMRTDVIVDLEGWITSATAQSSATGLVQAISPTRVLDTRDGGRPLPGGGATTQVATAPAEVAGFVADLATTAGTAAGYLTIKGACDAGDQTTSNLNTDAANQTRAALAAVAFATGGQHSYCLYSQSPADAIVDIEAYVHT